MTLTAMPAAARPLGRSPKIAQPISVANGSSRYCIGASVLEGAKRSAKVMTRCAAVPKTPRSARVSHSAPTTGTGESSGQSRPVPKSTRGARIAVATRPLAACSTTGSVSRAMARVMSMKKEKRTATRSGKSAGAPTAMKLGWTTISVPTKPTTQAARRCGPTCSPAKRSSSRMKKGITKQMATVSAIGRKRSAAKKAPSETMCSTVRTTVSRQTRGESARLWPPA